MWWYTFPMIIYTLFDQVDFSGKTLIPFNTHMGSGDRLGYVQLLRRSCLGAFLRKAARISNKRISIIRLFLLIPCLVFYLPGFFKTRFIRKSGMIHAATATTGRG